MLIPPKPVLSFCRQGFFEDCPAVRSAPQAGEGEHMLPLFEIIMTVGGIHAIVFAKVPWYWGTGLNHQVEAKIVRWFRLLLILPSLLWALVFLYSPYLLFMVDVLTIVAMAILLVTAAGLIARQGRPVNDIKPTTTFVTVGASAQNHLLPQIL